MGWTFTERRAGTSHKDWFQENVFGDKFKITDSHSAGRQGPVFLRVANLVKEYEFIAVILIRWNPRDCDGFNFGYKDMDESSGPYEYDCPLRMLEGLPEPSNEWAKEWREKVRAFHANRPAKLSKGAVIRFKTPISFRNGDKLDTLVWLGGSKFIRPEDRKYLPRVYSFYRLPHFRREAFELVTE